MWNIPILPILPSSSNSSNLPNLPIFQSSSLFRSFRSKSGRSICVSFLTFLTFLASWHICGSVDHFFSLYRSVRLEKVPYKLFFLRDDRYPLPDWVITVCEVETAKLFPGPLEVPGTLCAESCTLCGCLLYTSDAADE